MGTLVAGVCPGTVPQEVAALLHTDEQRFVEGRSGDSRRQWIAGRYCLAATLRAHALDGPVLPGPSGRPHLPTGIAASISHKNSVSVAIATTVFEGVGVDLEHVDDSDRGLAAKVLTKSERHRLEQEFPSAVVTMHFAMKEAVYKAAPDDEQSALEFDDIEVTLPAAALSPERTWESVLVSVRGATSEYRGFVLRDGLWILAVATRFRG